MQLGNWQLDTVNGGTFRLDGGVMFGVVPKSLWKNVVTADEKNRIACANHCILARDGRHTVLVDTGYGGKFDKLDQKFYAAEPGEPLLASLDQLGVTSDQVDTLVLSHLHFDHVGGATRYDQHKTLVPTFPNARHIVGRLEWEDATACTPELETAYSLDGILPLAPLVIPIDDGSQIVPGLSAWLTGGHTRGHLSFVFSSGGQAAIYLGDICPSRAHMRRMWHLAYDTLPLETRRRKPELLGQAADHNWWVLWNHDPAVAASRVARDPKREFVAVDPQATL